MVVGATGYVGTAIMAAAERRGLRAIGTSRSKRQAFQQLALEHPESFDYTTIDQDMVILLTAAISSPDRCATDYDACRALNVEGSGEFIARSLDRGARVIFLSSDAVYGEAPDPVDEVSECHPKGAYAVMKFEIEERFRAEPRFKTARLSYVFSRDDKYSSYLADCARSGTVAEVFHPFYRNVVHRNDVVDGLLTLSTDWDRCAHAIVNFGGPSSISRLDIARTLKQRVFPNLAIRETTPDPAFFDQRPRDINLLSKRLETLLGRPPRSLAEAIEIDFNNGAR